MVEVVTGHPELNVHVCANPGSGKSRSMETLAVELLRHKRSVCILTFNRANADEWRSRLQRAQASGALPSEVPWCVHTFDALACRLLGFQVRDASKETLQRLTGGTATENAAHITGSTACDPDAVLMDESQDLRPIDIRLLAAWTAATRDTRQFVLVGDTKQTINNQQSARDLRATRDALETPAKYLAACSRHGWHPMLHFTHSFRMREPMAEGLNRIFNLPEEVRILGKRPRDAHDDRMGADEAPIDYYVCDIFKVDVAAAYIVEQIAKYGAGGLMIVGPRRIDSDNNGKKNPIQMLTNHLAVRYSIHMAAPNEACDGAVARRYTLWTCKGLQAPLVVYYGCDTFMDNVTWCHHFVGLTRASHKLLAFQHYANPTFDGCKTTEALEKLPRHLVRVVRLREMKVSRDKSIAAQTISVTTLLESGVGKVLEACVRDLSWECASAPDAEALRFAEMRPIRLAADAQWTPFVADAYGTAVPMMVEARTRPPRLYEAIFAPVLLETAMVTNERFGLQKNVRELLLDADAFDREVSEVRRLYKSTAVDAEVCKRLEDLGFSAGNTTPAEGLHFVIRHVRDGHKALIKRADEYSCQFPYEYRTRLEDTLPPRAHDSWTPGDCMRASIAAQSFNGSHVRMHQIDGRTEWDEVTMRTAALRLEAAVGPWCDAEEELSFDCTDVIRGHRPAPVQGLQGRIDFRRKDGSIVECKTKSGSLECVDFAQLVVYALMDAAAGATCAAAEAKHTLVNTMTGEVWCIPVACFATDDAAKRLDAIAENQLCGE